MNVSIEILFSVPILHYPTILFFRLLKILLVEIKGVSPIGPGSMPLAPGL